MAWDTPITIGKTTESQYALDSKKVYCMAKYNDTYNEMTLTDFAKDFEKKLKEVEFPWKHKKGNIPRYPSYAQMANNWFKKYKWEACAIEYAKEKTGHAKEESILIFDKKLLKDTIVDFKLIDTLHERIETLQKQEKFQSIDNTYRIAKIEETINSIWHRIHERLELDKKDTEDTTQQLTPIDNNPVWEDDNFLEQRRNMLWTLVKKRGDD